MSMPSNYAHYRFGVQLLAGMPDDVRRTVQRFRQMYDVGLHGPDMFFFYNILMDTPTGRLGNRFHHQTGAEFFSAVARRYRLEPSEAGLSYICGLLAHYALDSRCHPLVKQACAEGRPSHVQIETEFDRYLLVQDGKVPPQTQDYSGHMHLTPGECRTAARLLPGVKPIQIRRSLGRMALCTRLLAAPQGLICRMRDTAVALTGNQFSGSIMGPDPDPQCAHLDGALGKLYDQALAEYPKLLEQLRDHLNHKTPLGADFSPQFE